MKLYYSPAACSLSPHLVLHEAGPAHTPVLAKLGAFMPCIAALKAEGLLQCAAGRPRREPSHSVNRP